MSGRNGFDGPWNPVCPLCGGYMHAHHEPDCPSVLRRRRENERLVELMRDLAASASDSASSSDASAAGSAEGERT